MLVKAYIEERGSDNTYKIRIPTLNKIKNDSLSTTNEFFASVSSILNCKIDLYIGDCVYIDFENNDRSKPIIVGSVVSNRLSDYKFNSLVIDNNAILSNDIKIGDISFDELKCLDGMSENIQYEVNSLNSSLITSNDNIIKLDKTTNSINNSFNLLNDRVNDNIERIDSLKEVIGNEDSENLESIYGFLNSLNKDINNIDEIIGSVNSDTTISRQLEDIMSRLISLKDRSYIYDSNQSDNESINEEESNYIENDYTEAQSADFKSIINALRQKFPNGKYWNHAPTQGNTAHNSVNNQDGYTDVPCPKHKNCGEPTQTCNGYAPNGKETSWQCMGYANKCGYDVTGYDPEWSNMWKKTTNKDDLKNLKKGDIVRYKNDGHSIYIIDVSGNTVTYTDCNSNGHCIIRWDAKIEKSELKKSLTYIMSKSFR